MSEISLAQAIVKLKVPIFGENMKNKSDSPSCMFDPRRLLSDPQVLSYIGQEMATVINEECSGSAIIGMSTSGIAWAAVASIYSGKPMLYVRKQKEPNVSNKYIEGTLPEDKKLVLIDDLLFAGESKREALVILKNAGCTVTDIVVIIDRQIQRVKDGPSIQDEWDIKLHSLINMSEVIQFMVDSKTITEEQLANLIRDYQKFDRWDVPEFAKKGGGR